MLGVRFLTFLSGSPGYDRPDSIHALDADTADSLRPSTCEQGT